MEVVGCPRVQVVRAQAPPSCLPSPKCRGQSSPDEEVFQHPDWRKGKARWWFGGGFKSGRRLVLKVVKFGTHCRECHPAAPPSRQLADGRPTQGLSDGEGGGVWESVQAWPGLGVTGGFSKPPSQGWEDGPSQGPSGLADSAGRWLHPQACSMMIIAVLGIMSRHDHVQRKKDFFFL